MFIVTWFAFLSIYGLESPFGTDCYFLTGLPLSSIYFYLLFTFQVDEKSIVSILNFICVHR